MKLPDLKTGDLKQRLAALDPGLGERVPDLRRELEALRPRLGAKLVGPAARRADRFGMWLMLRRRYGRNYSVTPTQVTQVPWEPYLELSTERDQHRLFPAARTPDQVDLVNAPRLLDAPDQRPIWMPRNLAPADTGELQRRDFCFPSRHLGLTDAFGEQLGDMPENTMVHGRIYTPTGSRPKRALIALHGFGARSLDSVARFAPPDRMAARDIALVSLFLPHHGLRKTERSMFSGEYFMSGDVVRTFESILQGVADIRTTAAWLRDDMGVERIGLLGGSLGGYAATLTAAVSPEVDLLYAIAPPIRITESIDTVPLGFHMRAGLDHQRMEREVLQRLQDMVDPSCLNPALSRDRMRFIAGHNDLFVPHTHMRRLLERWKGFHVHWHDWGHLTVLLAWPPERIFQEFEDFCDEVGF